MRTKQDEDLRRSNIYWTVWERLGTEAVIAANVAKEDIKLALAAADEEMGHFYSYFAGSKAREAFSFAIMAAEYRDKSRNMEIQSYQNS